MRCRLIAVLICLIPFAAARAQNNWAQPIIDEFDFPGGTLGEYIESLRAAVDPQPVNVILRGSAAEIEVPEVFLKEVAVGTAIEIALPDPFEDQITFDDDGKMLQVQQRFETRGHAYTGSLVFVIEQQVRTPMKVPEQANDERHGLLEVFALAELVTLTEATGADIDVETIVDAAETALDTIPDARPADLRYHEGSSLLIVRGTHEQVRSVDLVLGQFYDMARSAASQERAQRVLEVSEVLAMIDARAGQMSERVVHFRRELELQRSYTKPRNVSDDEWLRASRERIEPAEAVFDDANAELAVLRAEFARLEAMLDMLRDTEDFDDTAALAATAEFATGGGEER